MTSKLRPLALLALVAALAAALAAPAEAARKAPRYVDLDKVPKPGITGAEIVAGLEDFVARFPLRQNTIGRDNIAASEFLAEEAKSHGFEVRILELEAAGRVPRTVRVVEAVKRGTVKPNNWLAFV